MAIAPIRPAAAPHTGMYFKGGGGARGVWLGPPSSLGPPMVPAEGGPKNLESSWHLWAPKAPKTKIWLSASNIARGGGVPGGGGSRGPPPAVYGRSNTSLPSDLLDQAVLVLPVVPQLGHPLEVRAAAHALDVHAVHDVPGVQLDGDEGPKVDALVRGQVPLHQHDNLHQLVVQHLHVPPQPRGPGRHQRLLALGGPEDLAHGQHDLPGPLQHPLGPVHLLRERGRGGGVGGAGLWIRIELIVRRTAGLPARPPGVGSLPPPPVPPVEAQAVAHVRKRRSAQSNAMLLNAIQCY